MQFIDCILIDVGNVFIFTLTTMATSIYTHSMKVALTDFAASLISANLCVQLIYGPTTYIYRDLGKEDRSLPKSL